MLILWIVVVLIVIVVLFYTIKRIADRFKGKETEVRLEGEEDEVTMKVREVNERLNEVKRSSPRDIDVSVEDEDEL